MTYESAGYAAPTCHDCSVTACDGICGSYSDLCGGGGEIINECAGAVDYGYSDCCGNNAGYVDQGYVSEGYESYPTESYSSESYPSESYITEGYPSEGTIVSEGYVDGGVVHDSQGGGVISEGTVIDHGTYQEGTVVDQGTYRNQAGTIDQGTVPQDSTPAEAAPAESTAPADFNEPPALDRDPMPPVAETETTDNDLFGNDDAVPADPMPAGDDLFGDGNNAAPADPPPAAADADLFGDESASEQPAADDDLGDLFGNGGGDTTPADTAPADDGLGDLFDEGAAPDPADEAGLEDLFGDEPDAAPLRPADNEGLEDLFDDADSEAIDNDLDDLFGQVPSADDEVTRTVSFVASSLPVRSWWDDTGQYRTVGSLFFVGEDFVRLNKSNGRTCTVPFARLSDADLKYVEQRVEEHKAGLKVAAR